MVEAKKIIKVIVADDQRISQIYVRGLLHRVASDFGVKFTILNASDGAELFDLYKQNPDVKLVITDHDMAPLTSKKEDSDALSGSTAASNIRALEREMQIDPAYIIAMSANDNEDLFLSAGVDAFCKKPLQINIIKKGLVGLVEAIRSPASEEESLVGLFFQAAARRRRADTPTENTPETTCDEATENKGMLVLHLHN